MFYKGPGIASEEIEDIDLKDGKEPEGWFMINRFKYISAFNSHNPIDQEISMPDYHYDSRTTDYISLKFEFKHPEDTQIPKPCRVEGIKDGFLPTKSGEKDLKKIVMQLKSIKYPTGSIGLECTAIPTYE